MSQPADDTGTGTAIEPTDITSGLSVAQREMVEGFHAYMRERAAETANSTEFGEEVMARQALSILAAADTGSDDDLWDADAGGTIQMRDIPSAEVRIYDMRAMNSARDDIETPHGYYITCNATLLSADEETIRRTGLTIGEEFVVQTGAFLIMAKLRAFEARGRFPLDCLIQGTRTQKQRTVLRLRPIPRRVVSE